MNGRVGVSWSGGGDGKTVGSGTQLYNNHVEVAAGTTCWSVDGKHKTKGSSTNENRGYNQQGYASNLTMNTGHINRQKASDTPYETVDEKVSFIKLLMEMMVLETCGTRTTYQEEVLATWYTISCST